MRLWHPFRHWTRRGRRRLFRSFAGAFAGDALVAGTVRAASEWRVDPTSLFGSVVAIAPAWFATQRNPILAMGAILIAQFPIFFGMAIYWFSARTRKPSAEVVVLRPVTDIPPAAIYSAAPPRADKPVAAQQVLASSSSASKVAVVASIDRASGARRTTIEIEEHHGHNSDIRVAFMTDESGTDGACAHQTIHITVDSGAVRTAANDASQPSPPIKTIDSDGR